MTDAARRALGAKSVEANRGVIIETVSRPSLNDVPVDLGAQYTRRGYKTPAGKKLYEATSSGGKISVRASATEMRYATNVIDLAGNAKAREGQIRSFFATIEEAQQQADALRTEGFMVDVVFARPYAGQPGDQ
ncbi:MAG: hypothetical protein WCJ18_00280 [Planctomycetota bacterium]